MERKFNKRFLALAIDEYVDLSVDIFHLVGPLETDADKRYALTVEAELEERLEELQKLADWLRDIAADLRKA